jgi:hypothetical protein
VKKKESTSFLKKRSKKLLSLCITRSDELPALPLKSKSFLLLFFKKEDLPFGLPG